MICKWIGAAFIIVSCGGFGIVLAASHRREEGMLRQLCHILEYMSCELQYRLTPLPELCRQAGKDEKGEIRQVFRRLAEELEAQIAPDVDSCMRTVLSELQNLPSKTLNVLYLLGNSLGRFDLDGQLKGLESVRGVCRKELDNLSLNRDNRLRSYQTLGFCAGAALAILFI